MNKHQKAYILNYINNSLQLNEIKLEINRITKGFNYIEKQQITPTESPNKDMALDMLFWYHVIYNNGKIDGNIYRALTQNKPNENVKEKLTLNKVLNHLRQKGFVVEVYPLPSQYNIDDLFDSLLKRYE